MERPWNKSFNLSQRMRRGAVSYNMAQMISGWLNGPVLKLHPYCQAVAVDWKVNGHGNWGSCLHTVPPNLLRHLSSDLAGEQYEDCIHGGGVMKGTRARCTICTQVFRERSARVSRRCIFLPWLAGSVLPWAAWTRELLMNKCIKHLQTVAYFLRF